MNNKQKDEQDKFLFFKQICENVRPIMGAATVVANSSRPLAEKAAKWATEGKITDNIYELEKPGVVRCSNCGLAVKTWMRLPVKDRYDSVVAAAVTPRTSRYDYIRIPLEFNSLNQPAFVLSEFVFCTPPCGLRYIYDDPSHKPTIGVDDFHRMMRDRHGVDEPINAAPPALCMEYLYKWEYLPREQENKLMRESQDNEKKSQSNEHTDDFPRRSASVTWAVGLSPMSFYSLLSEIQLIGSRVFGPAHLPPHYSEHVALQKRDSRYLQYFFQDNLMPHVAADIFLPDDMDECGIQLDANPDSDGETDFATDDVHPTQT